MIVDSIIAKEMINKINSKKTKDFPAVCRIPRRGATIIITREIYLQISATFLLYIIAFYDFQNSFLIFESGFYYSSSQTGIHILTTTNEELSANRPVTNQKKVLIVKYTAVGGAYQGF